MEEAIHDDTEEEIREQLEANRDISDAVRDACFRPWSDPFVRTTAYEIPLEKYPPELGMALSHAIVLRFPDYWHYRQKLHHPPRGFSEFQIFPTFKL